MSWCGSCCIYPLLCGASQPPPGSLPPFLPASVGWLAACSRCCWQHMRVRGRGKRWDVARKRSAGPLLLVAGGVGAAPLISMLLLTVCLATRWLLYLPQTGSILRIKN